MSPASPLNTTRRTPEPREAARQTTACEEFSEFAFDELRQPGPVAPIGRASAQRLEVTADDAAQDVPIGLPRLVLERGDAHRVDRRKRRAECPGPVDSTSYVVAHCSGSQKRQGAAQPYV